VNSSGERHISHMSTQIFIFIILALGAGTAFGYFLRWVISLGKKGSMELEIKQMKLDAKEEAQKIIEEAEKESATIIKESTQDLKEKERDLKKTEERLIKKETLLDNRQADIDAEFETVKKKTEEVQKTQEELNALLEKRTKALEKISELSTEEARKNLLETVENEYQEDILARIQKMEQLGVEQFEEKAREILTTAIHRIGNNMPNDVIATCEITAFGC